MIHRPFSFLIWASWGIVVAGGWIGPRRSAAEDAAVVGPSVSESVHALQVAAGYRVHCVAFEPQVIDPVTVRFDHSGTMWVVEMRDYPTGPVDGGDFNGQVKRLRDLDGDGVYENAAVFASGLCFPTGVQPWRDGAIVTLAGEIRFFRDLDGDGRSDTSELWFSGFTEDNEQLRANHPTLAADGRVYVAGGLRGGRIRSRHPDWPVVKEEVDIYGADFAFDVHGGWYGPVTGNSQHGLSILDDGTRLGVSNRHPALQSLLGLDETRRGGMSRKLGVFEAAFSGGQSIVRPIGEAWTTSHLHGGQYSAACGITAGHSPAFPPPGNDQENETFEPRLQAPVQWVVCEPTGYLVQQQRVRRQDVGYFGTRVDGDAELLASRDPYFRPVDTTWGPDGGLYVVDMCRAVIEHPHWMPEELKRRSDLRHGDRRGRIWRVVAADWTPDAVADSLDPGSPRACIERLADPNPFWRNEVTRLLWQNRAAAAEALTRWAASEKHAAPVAISRAIEMLASLQWKTEPDRLRSWANHDDSTVRRAVIRCYGKQLPPESLHVAIRDTDPWVQFEALRTVLSNIDPNLSTENAGENPWTSDIVAALNQVDDWDSPRGVLWRTMPSTWSAAIIRTGQGPVSVPAYAVLWDRLATDANRFRSAIEMAGEASLRCDSEDAMWDEMLRWAAGLKHGQVDAFETHWRRSTKQNSLRDLCLRVARDDGVGLGVRIDAVRVLGGLHQMTEVDWQILAGQINEPEVANVVASSWFDAAPSEMTAFTLKHHADLPADVSRGLFDRLVDDTTTATRLLNAIDSQTVSPLVLSPVQTQRLLSHANEGVRQRATSVFDSLRGDRQAIIDDYGPSLIGMADLAVGRELFAHQCAACHRVGEIGKGIGPDISDSRGKRPSALLEAILDPSAAIDGTYACYQCLTDSGQIEVGLLVAKDEQSRTLQTADGRTVRITNDSIESWTRSEKSLMPEGFERTLDADAMRNLIGYLKGWRYEADGQAALDLSQTVSP